MARILCAWEIGDGHGHVRNLMACAKLLRNAGHQVIFALPAAQITAAGIVEAEKWPVEKLLLPVQPSLSQYLPAMTNYRADSFLDVMGLHAFDSADRLAPMLARYRILLEQHQVDVVLAESAPIAQLAAKLKKNPCLAVGTSFGLPEARQGFASYPKLDHWPNTPIFSESDLLKVVNRCVDVPFDSLRDAMMADRIIPLCYPALDHYGSQRTLIHRGVGPVWQLSPILPAIELRGFAYLQSAYPAINELVSAIRTSGIPFTVFVRNGNFKSGKNMKMKEQFDLQMEMEKSSFILHHGSAGIGQAALGAGIPQMCLPYHIENTNNAYRLQNLGVSKAIGYAQQKDFLEFLLDSDDGRAKAAQYVASQLDAHAREFPGARVVAAAVDDLL